MLFCLVNLVYNISLFFFLHTLASVNTGRRTYKSPRKCCVPAAFHNFFFILFKFPFGLHHIFSIAFYRKLWIVCTKTNNASFSIDKYESDYSDISLLRQINSIFSIPTPYLTSFSPVLFWMVSNLFTNG